MTQLVAQIRFSFGFCFIFLCETSEGRVLRSPQPDTKISTGIKTAQNITHISSKKWRKIHI